jgi:hypothetical protein
MSNLQREKPRQSFAMHAASTQRQSSEYPVKPPLSHAGTVSADPRNLVVDAAWAAAREVNTAAEMLRSVCIAAPYAAFLRKLPQ